MSDYDNPRPTAGTPYSDPCAVKDMATTLGKVVDGNSTVTTYNGNQILSLSQAIDLFGFGEATFTFATGGTLESKRLLVSNEPVDGFLYKYVGAGSAPITVTAGTDPLVGSAWQAFAATSLQALSGLTEPSDLDSVKTRNYPSFNSLITSSDDLSFSTKISTIQHTSGGIGGTTYVKDGTTGAANTGDEARFFDAQSNGWVNTSRDITTYGSITDDIAVSAQKAIDQFNCVYIPTRSDYVHKAATITLKDGSCINADNPLITTDGINFNTFILADDIKRWAILGSLNYKGSLVTGADVGAEIGLQIKGCTDYRVESFVARTCRSHSIKVEAGTLAPSPRGDQGQLVNCAGYESRIGVEIQADTTAEFNQFVNFNAAGCLDGIIVGAGNTSFVGGNCVDNTRGITVVGGANHAHGIVSGMNINHNPSWNIKCVSVTNGHSFNACHAYGNGGTTSPVWFENSKNCTFQNGVLDCPVYNDGTAGQNAILNNNLPGNDTDLLGTNPQYLRVLGNWTPNGAWDNNDAASEYSLVNRGGSTQAINNGTVLIFNNAIKDKRAGLNLTTGVYTAPISATYDLEVDLTVTGTFTDNSYLEVLVNNVFRSYIPAVRISANVMQATICTSLNLDIGDNVRIRSQIPSGATPILAAGSQIKISSAQ